MYDENGNPVLKDMHSDFKIVLQDVSETLLSREFQTWRCWSKQTVTLDSYACVSAFCYHGKHVQQLHDM